MDLSTSHGLYCLDVPPVVATLSDGSQSRCLATHSWPVRWTAVSCPDVSLVSFRRTLGIYRCPVPMSRPSHPSHRMQLEYSMDSRPDVSLCQGGRSEALPSRRPDVPPVFAISSAGSESRCLATRGWPGRSDVPPSPVPMSRSSLLDRPLEYTVVRSRCLDRPTRPTGCSWSIRWSHVLMSHCVRVADPKHYRPAVSMSRPSLRYRPMDHSLGVSPLMARPIRCTTVSCPDVSLVSPRPTLGIRCPVPMSRPSHPSHRCSWSI